MLKEGRALPTIFNKLDQVAADAALSRFLIDLTVHRRANRVQVFAIDGLYCML
jgi:hypothetical protein